MLKPKGRDAAQEQNWELSLYYFRTCELIWMVCVSMCIPRWVCTCIPAHMYILVRASQCTRMHMLECVPVCVCARANISVCLVCIHAYTCVS